MPPISNWILPAAVLVSTVVHALFAWHRNKPSDADRAGLLAQIAQDAAAFVLAAFPNKPWAELLNSVVQRILSLPGVPTSNTTAIENAAAAALVRLGKSPNGK